MRDTSEMEFRETDTLLVRDVYGERGEERGEAGIGMAHFKE